MKAELLELSGKYYGTEVQITTDSGYEYVIKLWNNGGCEPSARVLNGICTIDEWRDNATLTIDYEEIKAKDVVEICDSHFESQDTYLLARKMIDLINDEALVYGLVKQNITNESVSLKPSCGVFHGGC